MCGIFCLLRPTCESPLSNELKCRTVHQIEKRGPNCQFTTEVLLSSKTIAELKGCTLHLRGPKPIRQPLVAADNSFFFWNGEVFNGIEVSATENDTVVLFNILQACHTDKSIIEILCTIHGPWAFIYWQANNQRLWFGRDIFGRRSLLWTKQPSGSYKNTFALSSTVCRPSISSIQMDPSDPQGWEEVPAKGIFCLDLSGNTWPINFNEMLQSYKWSHLRQLLGQEYGVENFVSKTQNGKADIDAASPSKNLEHTGNAETLPSPITSPLNDHLPSAEDLDTYSRVKDDLRQNESNETANVVFESCLEDEKFRKLQEQLEIVLQNAIETRVRNQTKLCQNCTSATRQDAKNYSTSCNHSKVAILFSGGLDSTVICALADRFVPADEPIDLLNVAFEQRSNAASKLAFEVPDRITGRDALVELQSICKKRKWNFVEINVTKQETAAESEARIADLVYPLTTVLDNDIGCAVWFAARGKGRLLVDGNYTEYVSPARVVLTGTGADEQFGGYSRHRVCYLRDGWGALNKELHMEMERISERNLGRDDRVIADHGREGRFPFLDERVVNYVNSLCISHKVNLDFPRGIGDKLLLRVLAYRLGLVQTSSLAKRAIQFGSRISKMVNSRKGADTCFRLKAKIVD